MVSLFMLALSDCAFCRSDAPETDGDVLDPPESSPLADSMPWRASVEIIVSTSQYSTIQYSEIVLLVTIWHRLRLKWALHGGGGRPKLLARDDDRDCRLGQVCVSIGTSSLSHIYASRNECDPECNTEKRGSG